MLDRPKLEASIWLRTTDRMAKVQGLSDPEEWPTAARKCNYLRERDFDESKLPEL